MTTLPLERIVSEWVPGSRDQPWTWEDETAGAAVTTLPLERIVSEWVPGSRDQPWTWEDETAELLSLPCVCCNTPGGYQRRLEAKIAETGAIAQGIYLGPDGRMWDGHHRVVAAIRLGITDLPIEDGCGL